MEELARTRLLLGQEGIDRLKAAKVAVFGIGGVGSYAAEALARAGIGRLLFVDDDVVSPSNINRQLIALHSTLGQPKVEVMKRRALDINPEARVLAYQLNYSEATQHDVDLSGCDYIVDAVDTVSAKLLLIQNGRAAGIPVISCMGAGNKLDAGAFEVADIYDTSVCPLARVMRNELRKRGIEKLKVVYSREIPIKNEEDCQDGGAHPKRRVPGSISYVPSSAGLLLAGEVIRDIAEG